MLGLGRRARRRHRPGNPLRHARHPAPGRHPPRRLRHRRHPAHLLLRQRRPARRHRRAARPLPPRAPVSEVHPAADATPAGTAPAAPDPARLVEALLFAADGPVSAERLAELAGVDQDGARALVADLNHAYADTGRAFRVNRVAQGYQLYTLPEFADWIRRLYQYQHVIRLS
ncbi:SMC-Scp complex subunit ScpB, partial [candidate division WOR-3 bacterium]|nr:SMC-Scp complex subunit ScpB [candidate division WOR-3 bacterium]